MSLLNHHIISINRSKKGETSPILTSNCNKQSKVYANQQLISEEDIYGGSLTVSRDSTAVTVLSVSITKDLKMRKRILSA